MTAKHAKIVCMDNQVQMALNYDASVPLSLEAVSNSAVDQDPQLYVMLQNVKIYSKLRLSHVQVQPSPVHDRGRTPACHHHRGDPNHRRRRRGGPGGLPIELGRIGGVDSARHER